MKHCFNLGDRLVIATHNKGKLLEMQTLLRPFVRSITSAGELGLPEPEEDGATFEANALIKARAAAAASGSAALADDSGLCVAALGGQPGLYSARWCGPAKDPMVGMTRINQELGDNPDRSAYFISVLALTMPDGREVVFEGRCDGHLTWPPVGENGHGYDPFFVPDGQARTFGQMLAAEKDAISHRGRSLAQLIDWLRG